MPNGSPNVGAFRTLSHVLMTKKSIASAKATNIPEPILGNGKAKIS